MRAYEIYTEMLDRNLTQSLRSWSSVWLGHAPNFATMHQSKPLPAATALRLRRRLVEAGHHDLAARVLLAILGEAELPGRGRRSA